jgi:hypothetical protein
MDAGFVRKVEGSVKFIPLRFNLPHGRLPPLLRGLHSPEITDNGYEEEVKSLANWIHGISDRPRLGPAPALFDNTLVRRTGFSQSALRIAHYFVTKTEIAYLDPQATVGALVEALSLTREDVADGLHELELVMGVKVHKVLNGTANHVVMPEARLFARFDESWMDWDPDEDANRIASRLVATPGSGMLTEAIAREFEWTPRRLNPALTVLVDKGAIQVSNTKSHPFVKYWVQATDDTRRFLAHHS